MFQQFTLKADSQGSSLFFLLHLLISLCNIFRLIFTESTSESTINLIWGSSASFRKPSRLKTHRTKHWNWNQNGSWWERSVNQLLTFASFVRIDRSPSKSLFPLSRSNPTSSLHSSAIVNKKFSRSRASFISSSSCKPNAGFKLTMTVQVFNLRLHNQAW